MLVLTVLLIGLVAYRPALFGFILFTGYAVSGPIEWLFGWTKAVDDDDIFEPSSSIVFKSLDDAGGKRGDESDN